MSLSNSDEGLLESQFRVVRTQRNYLYNHVHYEVNRAINQIDRFGLLIDAPSDDTVGGRRADVAHNLRYLSQDLEQLLAIKLPDEHQRPSNLFALAVAPVLGRLQYHIDKGSIRIRNSKLSHDGTPSEKWKSIPQKLMQALNDQPTDFLIEYEIGLITDTLTGLDRTMQGIDERTIGKFTPLGLMSSFTSNVHKLYTNPDMSYTTARRLSGAARFDSY